ncbi:hypothetical protein N8569_00330 [bacterium]|nr:hypothetical protein [bacterium]
MTGGLIQLPPDLPGYMGNTPRMYFVVRQTTLVSFWGADTTRYTIVGFGGINAYPHGNYIQNLIPLDRFVNIEMMRIGIDEFNRSSSLRRLHDTLDILQTEFNSRHGTQLDITDYIRWHVYRLSQYSHCAAIAEGIPPP